MIRLAIAVFVGGLVLAYFGIQEFRVSMGTSAEPQEVSLAELEQGVEITNNHIRISEHLSFYGASVYEAEVGEFGGVNDSSKVNHVYYPVISDEHEFIVRLGEIMDQYQGDPPESAYPEIKDFKVLVMTKRFKTYGQIPDFLQPEDKLQGLLINQISSMDPEEEKLLQQEFPHLNMDTVLILEDGRHPSSLVKSLGMTLGGALLSLLSVGSFFMGRGGSTPAAPAYGPQG